MEINRIDAAAFSKLFLAGAKRLEANKDWINELNVFPVPDGDTGTNMTLTILSAAKEVAALPELTMDSLAKAISSGSLRGARGNSGVILSQLLRGFTKVIKNYDAIDVPIIANAMQKAVETAYKAVMKPKEGTILTVARGAAEKAASLVSKTDDIVYFLGEVVQQAKVVLEQTPEMLPILKESGVVDSGGQGLVQILCGAYDALRGEETDISIEGDPAPVPVPAGNISPQGAEDIRFGYCTEFIIMLEQEFGEQAERDFKSYLESIGDSLVVVADEEIVKVHVHTNDPGLAIQRALTYGALTSMKIDNMREEHQEKLIRDASRIAAEQKQKEQETGTQESQKKEMGFIAVSIGEGLNEIFTGLGVDCIITGGQTMNPSTEDMLNAIEQVNAEHVFIFPNNKNIILAANQARDLTKDKDVIVIPTSTIPQGISALVCCQPDKSPQENEELMLEAMGEVKSGEVTYAVRDTTLFDKSIHQGDIMGLGDNDVLVVGREIDQTTRELVAALAEGEADLISVYFGEEVSPEDAGALGEELEAAYPDCDVEVHSGGQPIYYYIVSVE